MADTVRVHKVASVVYRLELDKEVEITSRLEARSGNAVVVRALNEKRVYGELELENGRMSKIFRGDVLVGALGRRRALRGFTGEVPREVEVGDVLALLNRGGVIGARARDHKDLGPPVSCEVLGMAVRNGSILNVADARLPAVRGFAELDLPPIVVVSGSAMESGKTLFLSELTQELSKAGMSIAGGKLTGIACLRDLVSLEDHGAVRTASFLDAGYPSTAGLDGDELADLSKAVIGDLVADRPDFVFLELGDAVIGDYGGLHILTDPEISAATRMHVFCASDLVGAWGGRRYLSEHDVAIDLFSGPATDNETGVDYLEAEFGKPAINAYRSPERLAEVVLRHLGLEAEKGR